MVEALDNNDLIISRLYTFMLKGKFYNQIFINEIFNDTIKLYKNSCAIYLVQSSLPNKVLLIYPNDI